MAILVDGAGWIVGEELVGTGQSIVPSPSLET